MRKAVSLFAKVAVSGLLLYFALDLINIDTVRDRFRQVDLYWIVLGLLVLLIQAIALQRWSPTRHLAAVATVALQILRTPRGLASVFSLSIFAHLLTVLAAWCAARSVGANVSLVYLLYLVLPVVLISIVPISVAGWGVREGAMVAAFAYAGLPQSDGLIISLLFGALYLVFGAAGGIVWVLSSDRADRTAASPLPTLRDTPISRR